MWESFELQTFYFGYQPSILALVFNSFYVPNNNQCTYQDKNVQVSLHSNCHNQANNEHKNGREYTSKSFKEAIQQGFIHTSVVYFLGCLKQCCLLKDAPEEKPRSSNQGGYFHLVLRINVNYIQKQIAEHVQNNKQYRPTILYALYKMPHCIDNWRTYQHCHCSNYQNVCSFNWEPFMVQIVWKSKQYRLNHQLHTTKIKQKQFVVFFFQKLLQQIKQYSAPLRRIQLLCHILLYDYFFGTKLHKYRPKQKVYRTNQNNVLPSNLIELKYETKKKTKQIPCTNKRRPQYEFMILF